MPKSYYDDSWLQPLKDHTEELRRETEVIKGEVEELRRQSRVLRGQAEALRREELVLKARHQELLEANRRDAARYRWLKSRKALELRSCHVKWTRPDGTTFYQSHQLAEGGTGHAAHETLDETIDAAMIVAQERDEEGHEQAR